MNYLGKKLLLITVLLMAVNLGRAENVPVTITQPLAAAMQATGAELGEISVNGWAKLPAAQTGETELIGITKQAMLELGFTGEEYELTVAVSRRQQAVRAVAVASDRQVAVIAEQLRPAGDGRPAEVYLAVNIELKTQDAQAATESSAKISKIITAFAGSPQISTCLVGWLDGKLVKDDWDKRLGDAFAVLNADLISSTSSAQYSSFTGFSPMLDKGLNIGDRRINVNAAMRYSPYDNRTYVIIGSPVITIEY
ncbi:YwmB family TATA-box binding protein|uniref:TATA-box binding n=1 Tax=Dendrosporobacter quercicolus TaxID=146817 RepID=A0A1G9R1Y0_9FIRM|nr:YwmB family TATA-box binding protein [Dendrosporobacter quercicolus]NSL48450.1 YwmB family TATA-box binding protein [Dendrosporobacter quercicolus DSM 1736]SDM17312.1 TATA-box binding [Dendrosporobacter quercicolus]